MKLPTTFSAEARRQMAAVCLHGISRPRPRLSGPILRRDDLGLGPTELTNNADALPPSTLVSRGALTKTVSVLAPATRPNFVASSGSAWLLSRGPPGRPTELRAKSASGCSTSHGSARRHGACASGLQWHSSMPSHVAYLGPLLPGPWPGVAVKTRQHGEVGKTTRQLVANQDFARPASTLLLLQLGLGQGGRLAGLASSPQVTMKCRLRPSSKGASSSPPCRHQTQASSHSPRAAMAARSSRGARRDESMPPMVSSIRATDDKQQWPTAGTLVSTGHKSRLSAGTRHARTTRWRLKQSRLLLLLLLLLLPPSGPGSSCF